MEPTSQTSFVDRLSRITTIWTMVLKSNRGAEGTDHDALEALIHRYHGAVYRYLLGATRNEDVADELFQEFALRFARGGFRNADPGKGRFRDFLRTVLINLIHDHQRARLRRMAEMNENSPEPAAETLDELNLDDSFVANWRDELLDRAWKQLADLEERDGQPHHTVLQFRAANPGLSSSDMAAQLTAQLQPTTPFTDVGIRKLLQRARENFADFLLDEISVSVESTDPARLEEELIDLELLAYCRSALERRRASA